MLMEVQKTKINKHYEIYFTEEEKKMISEMANKDSRSIANFCKKIVLDYLKNKEQTQNAK